MSMENINQNLETSDFCLSSYLLAKNIPIVNTVGEPSGKCTFVFLTSKQLNSLINEYYQMHASVEPMAFFAAQKRLKQLIYKK